MLVGGRWQRTTENVHRILKFDVVRFVLVGVLNTVFSYGVYALLLYLGLSYALANFVALALGIPFSFRTQSVLVFRNRDRGLFYRYAVFWLVIFLVNVALIALAIRGGLNAYTAGALALLPMTLISYFVQKVLVFRRVQSVNTA